MIVKGRRGVGDDLVHKDPAQHGPKKPSPCTGEGEEGPPLFRRELLGKGAEEPPGGLHRPAVGPLPRLIEDLEPAGEDHQLLCGGAYVETVIGRGRPGFHSPPPGHP